MEKIKPFLRWAGSKRKTLSHIIRYWSQDYTRYFEPFMGSAALFFALKPEKAVLSDSNKDLIRTFCAVRNAHKEVIEHLDCLNNNRDTYYLIRNLTLSKIPKSKAAAFFIYLNRFCFNGLYRTNLDGKFNVPYCPTKTGALPNRDHLTKCAKLLRVANLHAIDFEEITTFKICKNDFIYLDPPYAIDNRRIFVQYGPNVFGKNDIERLKKLLIKIDKKKATFVLSYAWSPEIPEIFPNWNIERIPIQRNIAGFASKRKMDEEVLISNTQPKDPEYGTENCCY